MLTKRLLLALKELYVLPVRMSLTIDHDKISIPTIRGVWGAALHSLDTNIYKQIFEGNNNDQRDNSPAYILRDTKHADIEWIAIGHATFHYQTLMRAWDIASGMGLGADRKKFVIRQTHGVTPYGQTTERSPFAWALSSMPPPPNTPTRIDFTTQTRMLRNKKLITSPTLPDIALSIFRKITPHLPPISREILLAEKENIITIARKQSATAQWIGEPGAIQRYSGRQKQEIDMHGVTGHLRLPHGIGKIWPLICAGLWVGVGKGTVLGMGSMHISADQ